MKKEKYAILKDNLKTLGLYRVNEMFAEEAEKADAENIPYIEYLSTLIENQMIAKKERSINYRLKNAKFPFTKSIEAFDFSFQPNIDEKKIKSLSSLDFVNKAENILFIGPPGVGKTHLAVSFGLEACKNRIRTLFISAKELIDDLLIASNNNTLIQEIEKYTRLPMLIIDELGFIPISKEGANLFYQVISKKYEHSSIIITSNKPFSDWGDIFNDDVIAAAIIDRLVHHSHLFMITGRSYRVKEKLDENNKAIDNN